jgi:Rhamnan synthesis protein F
MQTRYKSIITKVIETKRDQGLKVLFQKISQRIKHEIMFLPSRMRFDTSEKLIADSGLVRADFYAPQLNSVDAVRNYVATRNASKRKPFPGFHQGIYIEQHGLTKSKDPLADYILNGMPSGQWKVDVISGHKTTSESREDLKVALHIHVHYPDMLLDILNRLTSNKTKPHLYITVTSPRVETEVKNILQNSSFNLKTFIVPNKGRDIAPFIVGIGKELVTNFQYIGHIHTKKSLQFHNSVGKDWHNFLMENVIGSENNKMMDAIIDFFETKDSVSLIFPDDPNTCGWDLNRPLGEKIAHQLNLQHLPNHFNFPVGSMFWIKARTLAPLIDLGLTIDSFVDEPLPHDGTIGHAIERLIGFLPSRNNETLAVTNTPGVTR